MPFCHGCYAVQQLSNRPNVMVKPANRKTNDDNSLGWDAMIRDAKKRIEDLNYSILVFEKRKAAGEPWPTPQSTKQKSEAERQC